MKILDQMAIGCLSNSEAILASNLSVSPVLREGKIPLLVDENPESAAKGYNRILGKTDAPIVILAHHDVYLPEGWERLLAARIAEVEAVDPEWGIIAAYGISENATAWGPVWSTSIGQIIGHVSSVPVPIQGADELLIVLRRRDGLLFDEALPHFHFYGSDIVQTSRKLGHGAWNVALPLVHNDGFKEILDENYDEGFHYMRRKWRAELPLYTSTVTIAWHGVHLFKTKRAMRESTGHRRLIAKMSRADPKRLAELCGWELPSKAS